MSVLQKHELKMKGWSDKLRELDTIGKYHGPQASLLASNILSLTLPSRHIMSKILHTGERHVTLCTITGKWRFSA